MNNTLEQQLMFPELETNTNSRRNYQIKQFDDPEFKIILSLAEEEEDVEANALERLGFFVVSETNIFND